MITVVVTFEVAPDSVEEFVRLSQVNAAARARADGALLVQLLRCEAPRHRFVLLEAFHSQEAIDTYYASKEHRSWYEAVKPMLSVHEGQDFEWLHGSPLEDV